MAMEVRPAEAGDIEAVAAFYDKAVLYLTQTVNYPRWEYGKYPSLTSVRETVSEGAQFLCEENGAVIGAVVLSADPQGEYEKGEWKTPLRLGEFLVIHTLAADPDLQRRGIATRLVEFAEAYAREQGYRAIRLDVVPDNFPARKLYEKMGFTFAGEKDLGRGIPYIPSFALYEKNF